MQPYYSDAAVTLYHGDCRGVLPSIGAGSVQTCITSPPYFGLRDYGCAGQIGLEPTVDGYVGNLVEIFREVRRVLRNDGTLWLVLGDSFSGGGRGGNPGNSPHTKQRTNAGSLSVRGIKRDALKRKDLIGIPWRVAFALQADGWYLRSDVIWNKPNPMPESVRDRPTRAHEYIFLLSKRARYYYDADAIKTPAKYPNGPNAADKIRSPFGQGFTRRADKQRGHGRRHAGFNARWDLMTREEQTTLGANKRSVWTVATRPFKGAHFATFPPDLIRPCVLAGAPRGGVVLDPFSGAGTTGVVARECDRRAVAIELNAEYCALSVSRWQPSDLGASA